MTYADNWRHETLEILEDQNFGSPVEAPTGMVRRCLELCKTPLDKFSVEDLRLMIGQKFGLTFLVPLALEHLSKDIFTEGDYFPGDLLANVLAIDNSFWAQKKNLWAQLNELIQDRRIELASHNISTDLFDAAS